MKYPVAETFNSVQGEGVYAGTPMTFIRFVGCSVGKKICHYCDTDFDRTYPWRGGGDLQLNEIPNLLPHVCLTGGEPLNQELGPAFDQLEGHSIHMETSGTVAPMWLMTSERYDKYQSNLRSFREADRKPMWLWLCVSPKPGWQESMIGVADEVKVIVPGLGSGGGWATLDDALRWSYAGKKVFLQPRNEKHVVNRANLDLCLELVMKNPGLNLSVQLHKWLVVR